MLAKMDDTLRELREKEPVLRDRMEPLTIFFTPAIGQLFMTNVTKVFSQAHPYVRFTLLEEEGATIRRLILEENRPALGIVATFDPIRLRTLRTRRSPSIKTSFISSSPPHIRWPGRRACPSARC